MATLAFSSLLAHGCKARRPCCARASAYHRRSKFQGDSASARIPSPFKYVSSSGESKGKLRSNFMVCLLRAASAEQALLVLHGRLPSGAGAKSFRVIINEASPVFISTLREPEDEIDQANNPEWVNISALRLGSRGGHMNARVKKSLSGCIMLGCDPTGTTYDYGLRFCTHLGCVPDW
ncbi:hypothetical protein CEK25_004150 [Fusarium fujikuroi]|nr:hypothetical protein CEK25_004150 [Fusarium fujikuroi]